MRTCQAWKKLPVGAPDVNHMTSYQQDNDYDCGLVTLLNAEDVVTSNIKKDTKVLNEVNNAKISSDALTDTQKSLFTVLRSPAAFAVCEAAYCKVHGGETSPH
jgi:hypothetical protein